MPLYTEKGYAWVPYDNQPTHKVTVTASGGTITDVTSNMPECEVVMGINGIIGTFNLKIYNDEQAYNGLWSRGNTVKVYADRDNATTEIFRGLIDKVETGRHEQIPMVLLSGRQNTKSLSEIMVTYAASSREVSLILTDLLTQYTTGYTTTNVSPTTTSLSVNWYEKPLNECIEELCAASGFYFRVEPDLSAYFFEGGSILSTTEAIVHDDNLIEITAFGEDTAQIRNRIIVYGQEVGGTPLIATAETGAVKNGDEPANEEIINDTNLISMAQVQERADYELSNRQNPPQIAETESYGLPSLKPGEKAYISDYDCDAVTSYPVFLITHRFGFESMTTKTSITKERSGTSRLIYDRIKQEQKQSNVVNQNAMRYSYNFSFDDSTNIYSFTGTEVNSGYLRVASGSSQGSMLTSIKDTGSLQVSAYELRAEGDGLDSISFYVSTDGSVPTVLAAKNTKYTASGGNKLLVRAVITDASSKLDSMALLYK